MSSTLHVFESPGGDTVVSLPFPLEAVIAGWAELRRVMTRQMPDAFTRDEWAYLITFLDPANLRAPFEQTFGTIGGPETDNVIRLMRPRGKAGVWLPGNVSLLGPLTMILLSLTGNQIRLKGATDAEDLTGVFLDFSRRHVKSDELRYCLDECVKFEVFDRTDDRNRNMAATSNIRIAFGSNAAVKAIHALDHPVDSVEVSFADRQSEAWIERAAVSDDLLAQLIRIFAIYGQAGCTSPRRAIILGASTDEVLAIRNRVRDIWPDIVRGEPAAHISSENVMSRQCAAALGWDATLAPRNAAMLAVGKSDLESFPGKMSIAFVPSSLDEAIESLPVQIQTIGYALADQSVSATWFHTLSRTHIERFVPLARMHHFGPVWDGQAFWRQAFDEVEIAQ